MHAHRSLQFVLLAGAVLALTGCQTGNTDFVVDNDVFGFGRKADRNYTNGMQLRYTVDRTEANRALRAVGKAMDVIEYVLPTVHDDWATPRETVGVFLGQQMYTPTDLTVPTVIEDDRPYAGWTYLGFLKAEEANHPKDPERDYVIGHQIELGIVGPASGAENAQKSFHKRIDSTYPQGWHNQLDNEPGIVATVWAKNRGLYLSPGRVPVLNALGLKCEMDTVSTIGLALGNVRTELFGGTDFRIGWNLTRELGPYARDYGYGTANLKRGPVHEDTHDFGIHFFGGVEGRGTAYNIFLDGNALHGSHSVTREPLVADLHLGVATRFRLGHGTLNLAYTYVHRTPEFREREEAHIFGSFRIWYQWN